MLEIVKAKRKEEHGVTLCHVYTQIHEINGKVKEYDRMCAFRSCASWDAVGIRF
jgi:hypothetical protein